MKQMRKRKNLKHVTVAATLILCLACVSGCGKETKKEETAASVSEESNVPEVVTYEPSKEILEADPYQGYWREGCTDSDGLSGAKRRTVVSSCSV